MESPVEYMNVRGGALHVGGGHMHVSGGELHVEEDSQGSLI